ncbi:unnamed protein product, partial [Mesorhabditis spiculigera]
MLIKDGTRHRFYDIIKNQHVLMLVGDDVDGLCASVILTHLLRCDDAAFSIVPVACWEDISKVLNEHEPSPYIVMINCGGNRDITELNIPETTKVFIFDNRRPFDLENIYNESQVTVMADSKEVYDSLKIPEYPDLYRPDSDSEDEDEESEDRMEAVQRRALKREERRRWEQKKDSLIWDYYGSSWVSTPTALQMFELAFDLSRASSELWWYAAVAINSLLTDHLITKQHYMELCCDRSYRFIHRFSPAAGQRADDLFRISFEKELPIPLYSHWSLHSAARVDETFACRTKNWTQKGESDTKFMYLQMSISIAETRQKFSTLKTDRRKEIVASIEKAMEYNFSTFIAHIGFSMKVLASDISRVLALKLEAKRPGSSLSERFTTARELLTGMVKPGEQIDLLKGIEAYKVTLEKMYICLTEALTQSEVRPMGPYFLFICQRDIDESLLESRHFLTNFLIFLQKAFVGTKSSRTKKPLIVSFKLGGERQGWHVVTGAMPLASNYQDHYLKNILGNAYDKCHDEKMVHIRRDYFDHNIVLLKSEDRTRFFDKLQALFV